jgi:hypothetical protein
VRVRAGELGTVSRLVRMIDEILANSTWSRGAGSGPCAVPMPAEYEAVIATLGAGEGFVGDEFVRLYDPAELAQLNQAYGFPLYLPGLVLFGSNGCGDAYAYDRRGQAVSVVKVPFVPLEWEYVEEVASGVSALLLSYARAAAVSQEPNPELLGAEVDQVQPICLGGSATDPKNQFAFPRAKHIEAVAFWNRTYREVKRRTLGG